MQIIHFDFDNREHFDMIMSGVSNYHWLFIINTIIVVKHATVTHMVVVQTHVIRIT